MASRDVLQTLLWVCVSTCFEGGMASETLREGGILSYAFKASLLLLDFQKLPTLALSKTVILIHD